MKGPLDVELKPHLCDPDISAYTTAKQIAEFQKMVNGNMEKARQRQKINYDKGRRDVDFSEKDRVWIKAHPYSRADKSYMAKLAPRWKGPYRVIRQVGPLNVDVVLEETGENIHVVNVAQIKPLLKRWTESNISVSSRFLKRKAMKRILWVFQLKVGTTISEIK